MQLPPSARRCYRCWRVRLLCHANAMHGKPTQAHGWLMAVGWTLIAVGIVVARHGKAWDPLWFHAHRAIQLLGLACALAGFILIFVCVAG